MIFVDRYRRNGNGIPVAPPLAWRRKARSATLLAIRNGPQCKINEALYKDDYVRAALEELFFFKCAYCERPLEETAWNVEHFRPKGRVAEDSRHPGYYWLAYTWENLYPSCEPCNQRRRDKPIWGDHVTGPAAGKHDQFPLEDNLTRVMRPVAPPVSNTRLVNQLRRERTLLIDPCWDNPEWYLTFDPTGQILPIANNPYAVATIAVFNLKRRRLRKRREVKIRECVEALKIAQGLRRKNRIQDARRFELWYKKFLMARESSHAAVAIQVRRTPAAFGVR